MGKGDISNEGNDEYFQLCWIISRGSTRNRTMTYGASIRILKLVNSGETLAETGNLLEIFKIKIMTLLSSQPNVL